MDRAVSLAISAKSSPGTKYITNYNSLRTYLHFRCSIQNIILKLTDTATGTSNIGQHQSRDKRHNSFMYSRS